MSKFALIASVPFLAMLPMQQASALSFTTAPATVSFVNEFQFNLPSDFYSFTVTTTIASAEDAPELVGQSFDWSDGNFGGFFVNGSFSIGGIAASSLVLSDEAIVINPPEEFDSVTGVLKYVGLFDLFNPNSGTSIDSSGSETLPYKFNFDLPLATGYEYFLGGTCSDFVFSAVGGLSEIDGCPVEFESVRRYVEGRVFNATITFGTPSPVPLPATAWLLVAGVAGLVGTARRKKSA